jgi:hypothetical protein
MLQIVRSMKSGWSARWYVSGVPHRPQNARATPGEDSKRAGSPALKAKLADGTVAHGTKAPPLALRQVGQWQFVGTRGGPPAR